MAERSERDPRGRSKILWKIGEVAELLGEPTDTIRKWEEECMCTQVRRSQADARKGDRLFNAKNIDELELIQHMVRRQGVQVHKVRERLRQKRSIPEQERVRMRMINELQRQYQILQKLEKLLEKS